MQFDPLLTPPRLAILGSLASTESLTFSQLKGDTGLQDGNLHVHAAKLVDSGYVSMSKSPKGRRQLTVFRITDRGIDALRSHVRQIQDLLSSRPHKSEMRRPRGADNGQVWL